MVPLTWPKIRTRLDKFNGRDIRVQIFSGPFCCVFLLSFWGRPSNRAKESELVTSSIMQTVFAKIYNIALPFLNKKISNMLFNTFWNFSKFFKNFKKLIRSLKWKISREVSKKLFNMNSNLNRLETTVWILPLKINLMSELIFL